MQRTGTFGLAALLMSVIAGSAFGWPRWHWTQPCAVQRYDSVSPNTTDSTGKYFYLTDNNGSHAVAMTEYSSGNDTKVWTSILTQRWNQQWDYDNVWHLGYVRAFEYEDVGASWRHWTPSDSWPFKAKSSHPDDPDFRAMDCHVANNALYKSYTWRNEHSYGNGDIYPEGRTTDGTSFPSLTYQNGGSEDLWWPSHPLTLEHWDSLTAGNAVTIALWRGPDSIARAHGCVVFSEWNRSGGGHTINLARARTTDGGRNWITDSLAIETGDDRQVSFIGPTLATDDSGGHNVYLAYDSPDASEGVHHVAFRRSTNWGDTWSSPIETWNYVSEPCIAAVGQYVVVCVAYGNNGNLKYKYSKDGGEHWGTKESQVFGGGPGWKVDHANVTAVTCPHDDIDYPGFLVVARVKIPGDPVPYWTTRGEFLHMYPGIGTTLYTDKMYMSERITASADEPLNPSVAATLWSAAEHPIGCCVTSEVNSTGDGRCILESHGSWYPESIYLPAPMNTARLIAEGADHALCYANAEPPFVTAGPVFGGYPVFDLADAGGMPALALDADNGHWLGFVRNDTVWCYTGGSEPEMVFAGSGSAVPGQPSIVCYPNQANGAYVGAVSFAVYDTANDASLILFARVDTGGVVLDTIESVANLADSLPEINVFRTDTLIVTYQHGDSVLSRLLADYGPGVSTPPPAWSSPSLVTADGYHSMSVFDVGGSVLNCVWTVKDGSNFAISRATYDPTSMFAGWTSQSDPSTTSGVEKANPVYAGVGCSVWEQMASGKWTIKAKVRGEEKTLMANDTDAYRPHAVAESVACNPSTDRINLYLLYTAGVTFEVDSGVFDTGEIRFTQFEYDVSHAGANATAANTGTKLLRKTGGDSLYCLYSDADGAVWFARSAAGDSWKRDMLVADRDWPAIAEDSSGQRWAVLHGTDGETSAGLIEAYYLHNSTWELLQTIFTNASQKSVGPAALAGASSTSSPIAYAAFKVEGENEIYTIKVAKFDGSSLDTCTIASGSSLGDPSIAVEPVSQDSDFIHVVWSDNGEIEYRMNRDGRGSTIAGNWTSAVNLSNTQAASAHPFIAADRSQVVVAWAEGSIAEVYSRKRSTSSAYNNWESAVNLSNTANTASDWPTIAMGDTVVLAWSEYRTGSDYDIMACIDFGDTINIADNATESGYPHVLFQNKASGDTAIPYLLVVWSEAPAANVYEVEFNKLNLKQAQGGGQQSAAKAPLPTKPSLSACRPNPFQSRTTINYQLPNGGNVRLEVYDVTGRTVRTLASGHKASGSYTVNWDSRDNRGREVPRGVYFYRLDTPGFRAVKKAIVAR